MQTAGHLRIICNNVELVVGLCKLSDIPLHKERQLLNEDLMCGQNIKSTILHEVLAEKTHYSFIYSFYLYLHSFMKRYNVFMQHGHLKE